MCTSWPRAATCFAIGSMKVPTESPGNRGYDVVTITTTWRMSGPRAEHEAPGHDQRLDQHVRRQLRLPEPAFDEDDGHLGDAEPSLLGFVQHFDEERVAVGDHGGDRQARERLAAPAAIAAGAVAGGQVRDEPDVAVAERAEQDPGDRPVDDAYPAVHVPRSDHELVRGGGADERREVGRIVREIAIHLADELRAPFLDGVQQAVDVRAAETAGPGPMQDLDAAGGILHQLVRDRPRPVRGSIVDDEQAEAVVREDAGRQQREVLAFVIGRRDDEDVHRFRGENEGYADNGSCTRRHGDAETNGVVRPGIPTPFRSAGADPMAQVPLRLRAFVPPCARPVASVISLASAPRAATRTQSGRDRLWVFETVPAEKT